MTNGGFPKVLRSLLMQTVPYLIGSHDEAALPGRLPERAAQGTDLDGVAQGRSCPMHRHIHDCLCADVCA